MYVQSLKTWAHALSACQGTMLEEKINSIKKQILNNNKTGRFEEHKIQFFLNVLQVGRFGLTFIASFSIHCAFNASRWIYLWIVFSSVGTHTHSNCIYCLFIAIILSSQTNRFKWKLSILRFQNESRNFCPLKHVPTNLKQKQNMVIWQMATLFLSDKFPIFFFSLRKNVI